MVRTLTKSALREIRRSLGRFLAVLAIVGLGVGFFAGLRVCQPAMIATGRDYLEEQNFYDFRLLSPLGFDKANVRALNGGNTRAEGAFFVDFLSGEEKREIVLRAHSLTAEINKPFVTAGRLPRKTGECAADSRYYGPEDIGSVIAVADDNDNETKEALASERFTITGLCQSPLYLNYERGSSSLGNGTVTAFLILTPEDFTDEAFHEIYLTTAAAKSAYTEEYDDAIAAEKSGVTAAAEEQAARRYDNIRGDAEAERADAEAELAEGRDAYEKAKAESESRLSAAKRELDRGEKELRDGIRRYEEGKQQLTEAKEQIQTAETALAEQAPALEEAKAALDAEGAPLLEAEAELNAAKAALDSKKAALDSAGEDADPAETAAYEESLAAWQRERAAFEAAAAPYREQEANYSAAKERYDSAVSELERNKAELSQREAELAAAPAKTAAARKKLERGRAAYEAGKKTAAKELARAEAELQEAEDDIAAGYAELDDLEQGKVYVLTREENTGYRCFDNDTAIVAAISLIFPVFFFLVAALVCATTMTRMIEEQRVQIGVLKAMGYGEGAITGKYLLYTGSAALTGAVLGFAVGCRAIPGLIWRIYAIMYGFAPLKYVFDLPLALVSLAAALLCSVGSTYFACRRSLRCRAAELIRPKAPKAGKRVFLEYVTPVWKRLSFLRKVSVRGVFRYRSRLILMILGIGGCTALLLTGFGISNSIKNIVNDEYEEIITYEYDVAFEDAQTEATFAAFLDENGIAPGDGLRVCSAAADVRGKKTKSATLIVPADGSVEGFISLHRGDEKIPFPKTGEAVINDALAEAAGIGVGDEISVGESDGVKLTAKVAAIHDNYVFNYVFVSADTYRQGFHREPKYKNAFLLRNGEEDVRERAADLAKDGNVRSVTVNSDTRERINHTLSRMDYVVLLVVICAAALAFIVLYNLTNINITERLREIATIKVLGFYPREVSAYVFREISVLSVLGSLAGLLMGKGLHAFVMSRIKIDLIHFPCRIFPMSYVLSFAITLFFTALVAFAIRYKLKRINMAESLKSVE